MFELIKELDKFNGITFNEEAHTYQYDGIDCLSVTGIINRYKKPFDTERIATNYAVKNGLSVFDVIADWEDKKNKAAVKGTHLHKYAELKFLCKQYQLNQTDSLEILHTLFNMIDSFYNDVRGKLIPVRTEMIVGDKNRRLCGMIDKLFYNVRSNELQIWDYKTNKEIKIYSPYKNKMINGLEHLHECEFNTYSLQLALYKKIIQENTNLKLGNSYICWVNENNDTYKPIKTADMENEINQIWSSLVI
jgi:hypothetical protein